jgi:hypothetical protein
MTEEQNFRLKALEMAIEAARFNRVNSALEEVIPLAERIEKYVLLGSSQNKQDANEKKRIGL